MKFEIIYKNRIMNIEGINKTKTKILLFEDLIIDDIVFPKLSTIKIFDDGTLQAGTIGNDVENNIDNHCPIYAFQKGNYIEFNKKGNINCVAKSYQYV